MTVRHVPDHTQTIFSEYGSEDTLVSDNGACYNAAESKQAMEGMDLSQVHYTAINQMD